MQAVERTGKEVVEHHIGAADQFEHNFPVLIVREVEGNAQLVPIDAQEIRALAGRTEWRAPAPGFVPALGSLDFYDVRAEIAQYHGAYWSSQHPAQIQDFKLHSYFLAHDCRVYVV